MYQVLKLVRSRVKKNEMEPSIFLETNPQAIVETATIKQIYDNIHLDQLQAGLAPTIPADEAPLWRKITGLTVDVTKARHCKCEYPVSPGVMWVNHNGKDIGKMGAHACCVQVAKEVNERAKRMKSNMQVCHCWMISLALSFFFHFLLWLNISFAGGCVRTWP
eukprot:TRINITY_DN3623_c0_g1_i1.p1 TRINITY_DN3623_c0_g1~~TRINITY_DN3623_c0_g1_i1.p1  ORF type:complete len:185 (+),score=20.88 TRINITY_DN3623_c0_g1_i1:68-556(+)